MVMQDHSRSKIVLMTLDIRLSSKHDVSATEVKSISSERPSTGRDRPPLNQVDQIAYMLASSRSARKPGRNRALGRTARRHHSAQGRS